MLDADSPPNTFNFFFLNYNNENCMTLENHSLPVSLLKTSKVRSTTMMNSKDESGIAKNDLDMAYDIFYEFAQKSS